MVVEPFRCLFRHDFVSVHLYSVSHSASQVFNTHKFRCSSLSHLYLPTLVLVALTPDLTLPGYYHYVVRSTQSARTEIAAAQPTRPAQAQRMATVIARTASAAQQTHIVAVTVKTPLVRREPVRASTLLSTRPARVVDLQA